MKNLTPLNQSSKLIRPPTLKRGRLGDSQSDKVSYELHELGTKIQFICLCF